ncbi:hypothetical protein MC885_008158, partial [Smutsia gigantea]
MAQTAGQPAGHVGPQERPGPEEERYCWDLARLPLWETWHELWPKEAEGGSHCKRALPEWSPLMQSRAWSQGASGLLADLPTWQGKGAPLVVEQSPETAARLVPSPSHKLCLRSCAALSPRAGLPEPNLGSQNLHPERCLPSRSASPKAAPAQAALGPTLPSAMGSYWASWPWPPPFPALGNA